jgi:hypothetical protein
MKIPNVNCKYVDSYGRCNKKPLVWKFFKPICCEVGTVCELLLTERCEIACRMERPSSPPPTIKKEK